MCNLMLNLNVSAVHLDSTCGTNGVKKSSDETAGSQSLFMNNTEHSTFSANSLVRKTEISLFKNKNRKKLQINSIEILRNSSYFILSLFKCHVYSVYGVFLGAFVALNGAQCKVGDQSNPGAFFFLFQTHKNEEESSGNQEERGEKTDVAISFVFGQNIKDRAKVG